MASAVPTIDSHRALFAAFEDLKPISRRWFRELRGHDHTLRLLAKSMPDLADKRILDVGCGIGILVHTLNRLGTQAEGIDKYVLEEWGMEGERVQTMWLEKGIRVHVGDFFSYNLPTGTYDAIVAENIIEHLPYTQKEFLEKITRLLKPGGILVMSTPNAAAFLKRLRALFGRSNAWNLRDFFFNRMPFGHVREFTGREVADMCAWSGLAVQRVTGNNIYLLGRWLRMPCKWPWIVIFFLTVFCPSERDTIFVVAKKDAATA